MNDDSEDPISKLDKLFPNLQYNYKSKKGCLFTMSVEINNKNILGFGSTLKSAKKNAAEHALKYLISSNSQVLKQYQSCENIETNNNIDHENLKKNNAQRVLFQNYECTKAESKYLESVKPNFGKNHLKNLHFHNKNLRNTNFESNLKVTSFKTKNHKFTNFVCNPKENVSFKSQKNPKNPNFEYKNPRNNNFERENIKNTNFEFKNFENRNFDSKNPENTNIGCENFGNTDFDCENLVNTDFKCENTDNMCENFENTDFECDNLENTNFECENLVNTNFECENLENTNFECENLENTNFECENLVNTNFKCENLENTNFEYENHENMDFECANLERTNFGYTNIENTNFETNNLKNLNQIDNLVDNFEIKMEIDNKNEKTEEIFFDNIKNPVAILNNLKNGTKYDLVKKAGRPHSPIFTVSVEIDDKKYIGQGSSIREAKNDAAKNALLFLQGKLDYEKNKNDNRSIKNSVSKLNEIRPGLVYNLVERIGPSHAPIFTYCVDFDGNIFYGKGQNVKSAKQNVADQVLKYLSIENIKNEKFRNEDFVIDSMSDSENMTNELQPGDVHTGQKRSLEDTNENVPRKTQKIKEVPVNINGKNPVALLNELRPGLTYSILQKSGPVHAPIFTMSVTIDGQTYEGVGGNKKTAKARAAENALRSFIQFPHTNVDANSPNKNIDFTADDFSDNNSNEKKVNMSFLAAFPKLKPQDLSKGPVMLLNEIYPGLKYTCVSSKEDTFEKFKTTVEVNGETFTGVGSSKKNSKSAAAKSALAKLLNVQQTPGMKNLTNADMPFTNVSVAQELTDYIGTLVCEKFSSLMVDDPTHSKRKVLAGIVMTKGDDKGKDGEVICVTTGTKCVSGEHISMNGASLNDMHAEIVARRCLLDYLYDQLEMMADPEKSKESILVPRAEGEGYRLKDGIQFHLYINTAPCGDARIFSPHEELTNAVDRHPNRRARGQLRTKIESGEGTIPVKSSSSMQTWDGILQGERLLTMSCSDKIARWNVLGLQGSLLSHFIEPIYLHTIVLGSLLHPVHMYRAICGRIENTVQGLPPPYRLNRPEMSLTTSSEVRRPIKAPNFSVNWTIGQIRHEVVNCLTGKTEQGVPSRLCKLAMFKRFLNVRNKVSSITGIHKEEVKESELMYGQAKNSVESYIIAKQNLGEAFVKADLGCWIKKPLEQDQFYVD